LGPYRLHGGHRTLPRFTAALKWYRAMALSDFRDWGKKVTVPTMLIWSDHDATIMGAAARDCGHYVTGDYRFEVLHGVSHWILDEQPDTLGDQLLQWFASHPI
jgi:pimeloyl-ACP methyl ester carboxylesterase